MHCQTKELLGSVGFRDLSIEEIEHGLTGACVGGSVGGLVGGSVGGLVGDSVGGSG